MMINETKLQIPDEYKEKIQVIYKDKDGYWAYLGYGWCWKEKELHLIYACSEQDFIEEIILNRTENILNVFLKNIDTDIQKVYYEKSVAGMFIRYKLMVCRRINEVNRELPFSLESTSIQFMIQLLPFILNLQKGAVVIIDAFDIALCDDFVKKLIIFLRENLNGQLIITTCNKLVTKIDIPQENIYFLYENHVKVHRIL